MSPGWVILIAVPCLLVVVPGLVVFGIPAVWRLLQTERRDG